MLVQGLTGTFESTLDEKKRFLLPARLRQQFLATSAQDQTYCLSRWMDGCVGVFSPQVWMEKFTPFLEEDLDPFEVDERADLKRFIACSMSSMTIDRSGRLLLPEYLIDYAGIKKNIVLLGVFNRIEIWSAEKFKR